MPDGIPGRDSILLAVFALILVTVVDQGSTLGLLIRLTGVRRVGDGEPPLVSIETGQAMTKAQITTNPAPFSG